MRQNLVGEAAIDECDAVMNGEESQRELAVLFSPSDCPGLDFRVGETGETCPIIHGEKRSEVSERQVICVSHLRLGTKRSVEFTTWTWQTKWIWSK